MWILLLFASIALGNTPKEYLLSKHTVGLLKLGEGSSPGSLYWQYNDSREHCSMVRLIDRNLEGSFTKGMQVYMGNCDIPAFVVEFHYIWQRSTEELTRAIVYSRIFRTAHGIGVGSTLGDLRQHYKVKDIGYGEGVMSAYVPELEMGFGLDIGSARNPIPEEWWKSKDRSLIPNDTQIESIGVSGYAF